MTPNVGNILISITVNWGKHGVIIYCNGVTLLKLVTQIRFWPCIGSNSPSEGSFILIHMEI